MRRRLLLFAAVPLAARAEPGLEPALAPPPDARLPLDLPVRDAEGQALTLGAALGGLPAVLAFADYDCQTLCGTTLGLAAATLPGTGLRPGEDFRLVVLGLDPRDGPAAALAARNAWLGESTRLADTARFLVATAPVVATVTQALGYQFAWRDDVLEHPLALLVLRSDGRLAASLPALRADPDAVRAALRPDAPGLFARVEQLCRGGASAAALRGALAVAGGATLTALVAGILLLRRRERRA